MSQRKSSEEVLAARQFGRELRRRRGEVSQEAFSHRLGITRSALANYELGRSLPKPDIIERIAEKLGVAAAELQSPPSFDDLHAELQRLVAADGSPTDDEWAFVHMLRISSPEVAVSVAKAITTGFENDPPRLVMANAETVAIELARLYNVIARNGDYLRGVSVGNITSVAKALAARVRSE